MHVSRAELCDQRQPARTHYLIEELDQGELSLGDIEAIVTRNRLASKVSTRILCKALSFQFAQRVPCRITLLQTTEDQFKGVPLQRHIVAEAVLSTQRPATGCGGVDTDTVQVDVLRVLYEIAWKRGKGQARVILLTGSGTGRVVHQTTDVWQTAVVLDVVKTKLGVIEFWHVPTNGYAELIFGISFFISNPRRNETLRKGLGIGQLTCKKNGAAAVSCKIVGGEEGTTIIRADRLPIGLYKCFDSYVLGNARRHVEHLNLK